MAAGVSLASELIVEKTTLRLCFYFYSLFSLSDGQCFVTLSLKHNNAHCVAARTRSSSLLFRVPSVSQSQFESSQNPGGKQALTMTDRMLAISLAWAVQQIEKSQIAAVKP